jgi:hypothetical protein
LIFFWICGHIILWSCSCIKITLACCIVTIAFGKTS